MVPRSVAVALLAVVVASGCRTFNFNVRRPEPSAPPPATVDGRAVIDRHNQNARRITGLSAKPSIVGRVDTDRFAAKGRMGLERPHNFRLVLGSTLAGEQVDLGSNDQGFWFWVRHGKPPAIYVCDYDEDGDSPPNVVFQPDWIVEALGLQEIPDEATVEKGGDPGTVVVVHRLGNGLTKRTVLDSATGQIREHRIFAADRKTVLAEATATGGYRSIAIPPGGGGGAEAPAILPRKVQLILAQNQIELEITLEDVEVNPRFDSLREALFAEPDKTREGYARVDLREEMRGQSGFAKAPTTVRETPAPPPAGGGIRLREPVPLGDDKASRAPDEPLPLAADLPGVPGRVVIPPVVGPRIPRAPGAGSLASEGTGWRQVPPPGFER
jgi:hypothetical protein